MRKAPSPELDTIVHRGDGTLIAAFRCPVDHKSFVDSGPIQNDIFVFPRSSVRIRHAGGPRFVADQTVATLYNRGQIYDRGAVSDEGDRCDWFAVPRAVALDAVRSNGFEPAASGPFSFATVAISERTYLAQRRLFQRARRAASPQTIDEEIYALLDTVVAGARVRGRKPAGATASGTEVAQEIRSLLSARPEEDWPLARLSTHFSLSPFQLCRAFRRHTGGTIHRYLLSLRLRSALERLELADADIAALAFDLGFSSHSHFGLAFGRSFGNTPSACRETLVARS